MFDGADHGTAVEVIEIPVITLFPLFLHSVSTDGNFLCGGGVFDLANGGTAVFVHIVPVITLFGINADAVSADGVAERGFSGAEEAGLHEAFRRTAVMDGQIPVITLLSFLHDGVAAKGGGGGGRSHHHHLFGRRSGGN